MNKTLICALVLAMIASCKDQPYLHHKLQLEKVADNCSSVSQKFEMNSNINGERFEFNKCLPDNFNKEQVIFTKKGDTVLVHFINAGVNIKQSDFHIILDIDTYPRYNFLTIDGDTFAIIPTGS